MITLYRPIDPSIFTSKQAKNLAVAVARPGVLVATAQAFVEALGRQEQYIVLAPGIYTIYSSITVRNDNVVIQGCGWETEIRFVKDAEFLFSGDNTTLADLRVNGNDVAFAKTYATKVTGSRFKSFNVWYEDCDGGLSLQGYGAHVWGCLVTGHTTCGILVSGDRCRIAQNEVEGHKRGFGDIRIVGDSNLVNHNQIPGGVPGIVDVGAGNDWTVNLF